MTETSETETAQTTSIGTIGVIGVGAIATAIVDGLCAGGAPEIRLSPRNAAAAAALAARHPSVSVCADNQAVLAQSAVVVLCVRPADARAVLSELAFRRDHVVVSAIAGLPVAQLGALVAPATKIARVIPLPAVATRTGITPVFPCHDVATALFDGLGEAVVVGDEAAFDAFSAATATIAAHFSYLDAIAAWLAAHDVPSAAANRYVAEIFAHLHYTLRDGQTLGALAGAHTTPGGSNELFDRALREAGVFDAVPSALDRVLARLTKRTS